MFQVSIFQTIMDFALLLWTYLTPVSTPSQRLKDAIDSRIAEEQARQGTSASPSPSSTASGGLGRSQSARAPRRTTDQSSSARTTPRRRGGAGSTGNAVDGNHDNLTSTVLPPQRGPDPNEFDSEFVVGEDDAGSESTSGTPKMKPLDGENKDAAASTPGANPSANTGNGSGSQRNSTDATNAQKFDLPTDVRVRLRRLDKLESRYQGTFIFHR